jgi:DNA-binding XRE family transcriptional regulator
MNAKTSWTCADRRKLIMLRQMGLTWVQISHRMARSEASCKRHYYELPVMLRDAPALDDSPLERFGRSVVRERTRRGVSQPALAKRLGISVRTLRRLENGDHLSTTLLIALCVHWDMDLLLVSCPPIYEE